MNIKERDIIPGELNINPMMIATLMGIKEEPIPDPYIGMIEEEIIRIGDYNDIKGGYQIFEKVIINTDDNSFLVNGIEFHPGRQVMKYIRDSEYLVFFICTGGNSIGQRSKELMKSGFLLEGYVADLVGSVLAEEAMELVHRDMMQAMNKKGYKSTNRYSPGYCDWNVEEQHKLFSLFPDDFCGVRLSQSALMHPIKSVSGVIGLGKNVKYHKYVCDACSNVECIYRNLKYRVNN
jgi:hypothetical protein